MATKQFNKSAAISAAAYLRKSTAGSDGGGGERQAKSIPQQTAEVAKLTPSDGGKYRVVRTYDDPTDIGTIIRITVEAWGANGYSRKLGRRISLARRNAAREGKRSGGTIPYGLASDGNGGLQPGDADKVAVVKRIFADFVGGASINSIAETLNKAGIPGPKGGPWYAATLKNLLAHHEYKGEFAYGDRAHGRFYRLGADGEVVEANGHAPNTAPVITHAARWKAIIEPALWDKAQRRLASFKAQNRRPRKGGYALSDILVCDNCGSKMYGCTREGGKVTYRCNSPVGHCKGYEMREDRLLPGLLAMLAEEVDSVLADALMPRPPQPLPAVAHDRKADTLRRRIEAAEDRILDVADKRTRQSLDAKITEMRDELDRLLALQDAPDEQGAAHAAAQLRDGWAETQRRFLPAAVDAASPLAKQAYPALAKQAAEPAAWHDWVTALTGERPAAVFIADLDRRVVNETFATLGAEVRLRFRTERRAKRNRHVMDKGRFRLGQRCGDLAGFVNPSLPSFYLHRAAALSILVRRVSRGAGSASAHGRQAVSVACASG